MEKTTFSDSSVVRNYEMAIIKLNSLQSNAEVLASVLKERQENIHLKLPKSIQYLKSSGMTMEDLDTIPVIHVSGTKGKGSTCAMCESILRRHGLKTGFFSSPHLISATERIRLDGQPISEELFSSYFWPLYDSVCQNEEDRPAYFHFLTIMAFHVFWKEKVDVAIMEVGVGGMYDCTNVVRKPIVCGITKLDMDHTTLLGDTIEKIAWQKAGIMKTNVPVFIDGDQPQSALQVFSDRAKEVNCQSYLVPELNDYDWDRFPVGALGLYGGINHKNASLALQLSNYFLKSRKESNSFSVQSPSTVSSISTAPAFKLTPEDALGLRLCKWPGRTQVLRQGSFVYFIDGAHTELSTQGCRLWFNVVSEQHSGHLHRSSILKVMIFNATGDRISEKLLEPFITADFDVVVFCTNIPKQFNQSDNVNFTTTFQKEKVRTESHAKAWQELCTNNFTDQEASGTKVVIEPFINEALWHVQKIGKDFNQVQILVTGSLHLVGGILNLIDPEMWKRKPSADELQAEQEIVSSYFHSS